MEDHRDFTTVLRAFMRRTVRTNKDLAQLTGISINTIESWTSGKVRRPKYAMDVLKIACALSLNAQDATLLLTAAGHPPLTTLQLQAQQTADRELVALLEPWHIPSAEPAATVARLPPIVPRYQLRPPVADFVGRAAEVEYLVTSLRVALVQGQGAIISGVQGMGGIGKTELAYAAAHQLRDAFPDAQIVLNLCGTSTTPVTAEQALQNIIHAFIPDAKLAGSLEALKEYYRSVLHGQHVLILADDAASAAQVSPLIPPSGSALLVTSRTRFSLPGMTTIDLEQFGEEEAVTLLRSICLRLSREEAQAIAHACGYLPLALRISASILRNDPALDVALYLQFLADERQRLRQLRDPDNPQFDAAAVLARSYAQLDRATQQVFRQLGVFVADFTSELAQTVVVAPADGDVEATLHLLLRRNLVIYDSERRRWRLHDLLCDLACNYLVAMEEWEGVMWRYARAAVQLAAKLQEQYLAGGDDTLTVLARFDVERPHIDAAHHWATKYAGMPESDRLVVDSVMATATIGGLRYDPQREHIPHWEQAYTAAGRLSDRHAEGKVLLNLAFAYLRLGDQRHAIPYCDQALAIARELEDHAVEGRVLYYLGFAYAALVDQRHAIPYYEQALAIAQAIGDRRTQGLALGHLGFAYMHLGKVRRAIFSYEQYLIIARALGDPSAEGQALGYLGFAYAALGEARGAISFYAQCLAIARSLGDRRNEGYALYNLGNTYLQLGEVERAIEYCAESLTIAREIEDRRMEGYALSYLAPALARQEDHIQATSVFNQALALFEEIGERYGEAECKWRFGLALVGWGKRKQALPLLRAAVAYEEESGHSKAREHAMLVARLEAGEGLPSELLHPASQRAVGADTNAPPDVAQP